jgi:tRNA-specific 2-thiouridylase
VNPLQEFPSFFDPQDFPPTGARVIIGISGGVDSATSSALLQKLGYDVECIYMKFFESESSRKAERDAREVGEWLNLPVTVCDCQDDFSRYVVQPFVEAYFSGRTPLPCSVCNAEMKFRVLSEWAEKRQADFIATGHYARKSLFDGKTALIPAANPAKDQSYFLYALPQSFLDHALFPLGNAFKTDVRQYAHTLGLKVSQKQESQDICFLSAYHGQYIPFLEDYLKNHPNLAQELTGTVKDENGKVLRDHQGVIRYTIGQRKGIGIAGAEPLYVFKIEGHDVYVGPKEKLAVREIFVNNPHWLDTFESFVRQKSTDTFAWQVQYRSTTAPVAAECFFEPSFCRIQFKDNQYGVSPGQAAVIRAPNGMVLGGGLITRTNVA